MITFDATQNAIVGADWKKLTWLFEVTESGSGSPDHYWSTKAYTFDAQAYTAKVLPGSFAGINTARPRSEYGIQAPDDLSFTVDNDDGGITAADLIDAVVHAKLVMADASNEEIIRQFKFIIRQAFDEYETIRITCEDYLQRFLKGDYPNTERAKTIFPSDDAEAYDDLCVPVPFGTAYIPLRSVYITDARYYLLGLASHTYTITEVHSPRDWPTKSTWTSGSYTFTQSTKADDDATDWRVFQPIIADADNDGSADANGLWLSGEQFLDALVKFTRDDTAAMTGPEDVIEFVLEDMGVPSADIDTGAGSTFETAGTTYTGWTLAFNGAYFYKRPREEVLAQLVTMCHSILSVEDKVRLRAYNTTSQATLTDADIAKGTWSWQPLDEEDYDSAYIAIPTSGEPQDVLKKYRVTATGNYDNISDEVLEIPFVSDTQDAQKIGMLHYEYKFLKDGQATFTAHEKHLALEPGDWITINDTPYGASKKVLIDAMRITKDGAVELTVITYSTEPDDWGDLSPSAISPASDDSDTYWSYTMSGPDATVSGGAIPNTLPGRLRVGETGNYILLDPADPIIKLDEGGTDRLLLGKLSAGNYGIQVNDSGGTMVMQVDSSQAVLAGFTIDGTDGLYAGTGATRVQMKAAQGFWAGATAFGDAPFRVDVDGSLVATDATITGTITATSGEIGGWTINASDLTGGNAVLADTGVLTLGTSDDVVIVSAADATYRLWAGNATAGSAPFRVSKTGALTATSATISGEITATTGSIGGFTVGASSLEVGSGATHIELNSSSGIWCGADAIGSAPFAVTQAGVLTAESGTIAGWTISADKISKTGIELDSTNQRVKAYTGANYVIMDASGLTGYDSVLGTTFSLPTDGSAPEFSSGIIKEVEYQIYTSGVIKTADDPSATGGLIINNTDLKGYNAAGTKLLQFVYDGADEGDAYIGDYDNSNAGISYDHSAGTLNIRGTLSVDSLVQLPSDENLVGYWALDDGAGSYALDSSKNGNHGTLENSPSWSADGVSGKSIEFDGLSANSKHIDCGSSTDWDVSAISVCAWVYINAFDTDSTTNRGIVSRSSHVGGEPYDGWTLWARETTSSTGYVRWATPGNYTSTSTVLSSGQWHFIVATQDASNNVVIYVDGENVKEDTATDPFTSAVGIDLNIGRGYSTYNDYYMDGKIDEVRIYDKVLTASEVKALYLYPAGNHPVAISGHSIKTGIIYSDDTNTYFDLNNNRLVFNGKTSFDDANNGIFIGYDAAGYYAFGFGASTGNYLQWDASSGNLDIKGSITIQNPSSVRSDLNVEDGADVTSTHTADNTSNVGSVSAADVAGWGYSGDTTYIDGGNIYTNTITASKINGAGFGTLTLTSGQIDISVSNGLKIDGGGDLSIEPNGDIILKTESGTADSNRAHIEWQTNGLNIRAEADYTLNNLVFYPSVTESGRFAIGYEDQWDGGATTIEQPFNDIGILAYSDIHIRARYDGVTDFAWIHLESGATTNKITLQAGGGGNSASLVVNGEDDEITIRSSVKIDGDENLLHDVDGASGGPCIAAGASKDLKIFHDGTDSYIVGETNDFYIGASGVNALDTIITVGSGAALTLAAASKDAEFAGDVGIGKSPNSPLDINLTTEDLEIVDAGSTGATEQDWIEVEVGGNTGYIRVHATK